MAIPSRAARSAMNVSAITVPRPAQQRAGRAGLDKQVLKRSFLDNLFRVQGKFPALATMQDYYLALAHTVRDHLLQRWVSTAQTYTQNCSRTVCYFSAEFLLGPHLANNLINLGVYDQVRQAVQELGSSFEELLGQEPEPGLGNGGGGWDGLPPVSSTRWLLWRSRRWVMASAMSLASLRRQSLTAGKSRKLTSGCATAIRGI